MNVFNNFVVTHEDMNAFNSCVCIIQTVKHPTCLRVGEWIGIQLNIVEEIKC